MAILDGPVISKPRYYDSNPQVSHPSYIDFFNTGGSNTGGDAVIYVQSNPAATWTIAHNKGRIPAVFIFDNDGNLIITDVEVSDTQVVVIFGQQFSGKALLL